MKFAIVTLFPDIFAHTLKMGVVGQAIESGLIKIRFINPREFTKDVHKTIDDRPFGGGDGMLMLCEPLAQSIESLGDRSQLYNIYLSPQGTLFNHQKALELSHELKEIVLVCGRYGGIDQRFINLYIDEEISLGDFVLSGGELPAMAVVDAVARQIQGVLGHRDSAARDSFAGGLLEGPQFTRPQVWRDLSVPEVLLNGNHEKINAFRECMEYLISFKKRPELLNQFKKQFQSAQWQKKFFKQLSEFELFSEADLSVIGLSKGQIEQLKELIANK